ncbi:MAG: hypothetical protein ACRD3B_17335 [Candidatus Sulfotelmatobacter sp.]
MRRLLALALLSTIALVGASAQQGNPDAKSVVSIDQEHTHWLEQVMQSIATIKPGMTRRQMLRLLTSEGGLYSRREGRYVYKQCPLIKVTVKFEPIDEGMDFNPGDKIVEISKPFLEFAIAD